MRFRVDRLQQLLIFCLVTLGIVLSSCSSPSETPAPTAAPLPSPIGPDPLYAAVDFNVSLPANVPVDQKLSIEVLDEVTGLALNSIHYPMKRVDDTHYTIQLPVPVGSVVKYRYIREGGIGAIEYSSQARQVRYRMFYTVSPGIVDDIVSGWNDKPFSGSYGRIQGLIIENTTNTGHFCWMDCHQVSIIWLFTVWMADSHHFSKKQSLRLNRARLRTSVSTLLILSM
jgi:hypothetical protein